MRAKHLLRNYPLIAITFAFICGLILSQHFNSWLALFLLLPAALTFFVLSPARETYVMCCILMFFSLAGFLSGNPILSHPAAPQHVVNLNAQQQESLILGTIKRIYGFDGEKTRIDVNSRAIRGKDSSLQQCSGTIRYTLKSRLASSFVPGSTVAVLAKLSRSKRFLTPGSFDYPKYLALQKIWLTGHIASPLFIQAVDSKKSFSQTILFSAEILREQIKQFIDEKVPVESAALYKALITGDRSSISQETLEQFKGSGCMHILAIICTKQLHCV